MSLSPCLVSFCENACIESGLFPSVLQKHCLPNSRRCIPNIRLKAQTSKNRKSYCTHKASCRNTSTRYTSFSFTHSLSKCTVHLFALCSRAIPNSCSYNVVSSYHFLSIVTSRLLHNQSSLADVVVMVLVIGLVVQVDETKAIPVRP